MTNIISVFLIVIAVAAMFLLSVMIIIVGQSSAYAKPTEEAEQEVSGDGK